MKILDVLGERNPKFFVSVSYGGNTKDMDWTPVVAWRPWTDFTFRNLSSLFSRELHLTAGPFDKSPPFCDYDKEIFNENMLEKALERFVMPTVNRMLQQACQGHQPPPYYGAGSAVGSSADWALRSVAHTYEMGNYRPLLFGETKLSAKWTPDLLRTDPDQWSNPLAQVQSYCSSNSAYKGLRYGFIITDQHLVVLRLASEPIGDGLAAARPQRGGAYQSHQRFASGSTDLSTQFSTSMSLGTGSQYTDSNMEGRLFVPPEYAVIPWAAHGTDKLTIKLSLFFLGLLAAFGERHICDNGYPELKSWRKMPKGYMQPATGQTKRRLEKKDVLEDNAQAGQGANQEYVGMQPTQDNDDASIYQDEIGGDGNTEAFHYAG